MIVSKIDMSGEPKFAWDELKNNEQSRIGQVWLARSDSGQEYEAYVVVDRKSFNEFEVFGWQLVSLDERQDHFGVFESQFRAVERDFKDMWIRQRVS
jgi:hypothetical protein